ncbi:MAG: 1-hydroxycarotenoid 3,4-desaturase CrtD [Pseudomonadota bacterium]
MNVHRRFDQSSHTVIIGAGMAGTAAAVTLSAVGEAVTLIEGNAYPGGKMRQLPSPVGPIDSGPTVFTMKYVFEELFDKAGCNFDDLVDHQKAEILARHAWDSEGTFDLFASREGSAERIREFFDGENAKGYLKFCNDAKTIYETLKSTYIGAQCPGPFELAQRIGLNKPKSLWALKPFDTLWSALGKYFPDKRLQQLFGRYATYIGSSPFQAPATLMLIAHVEQEGVWMIEGGMHQLAKAMQSLAIAKGTDVRNNTNAAFITVENGAITGVVTDEEEFIAADRIIYCGDISALAKLIPNNRKVAPPVPYLKRSISAVTFSMEAECSGLPLHRHNVFFSSDYEREFSTIFKHAKIPDNPTVYLCAQDRNDDPKAFNGQSERLLCLINAPAFGDRHTLSQEELETCQANMMKTMQTCGLKVNPISNQITQPSDFNHLFPGSGGALYGRASHGWMASFARPGARSKIPGLYLAGGSVHPGAGVPMATRSGMLAAEQLMKDRVLT